MPERGAGLGGERIEVPGPQILAPLLIKGGLAESSIQPGGYTREITN